MCNMTFDLQSFCRPWDIGFRVEVHDDHPVRNCTFDQHGNMTARNPSRSADAQACSDHLRWHKRGGPFISFFTNWNAALQRWRWMVKKKGVTKVIIVAVWLEGLPRVYDAFLMARALRFEDRQLDLYLPEVLVDGGISADSYRVLTIFHGKQLAEIALSVDGLTMMVEIPGDFVADVLDRTLIGIRHRPDPSNKLRDEVYVHTGTRDDLKFLTLALSIGNVEYISESNNANTRITCPFLGIEWHFT
ncbi:hypothetical protein F4810DRAFT_658500 [Camillea tinctor]|nr:hypothetical protein F4810DRAFT_658500 [Camillea tinctor]